MAEEEDVSTGRSKPAASRPAAKAHSATTPVVAHYGPLSLTLRVRSPDATVAAAVEALYGEMRSADAGRPDVDVEILRSPGETGRLEVLFDGQKTYESVGIGNFLHELDNYMTAALERKLPELYFVHAAALALAGRVTMIVGESGAGKSTTAYALAAAGFEYLSDELSPIEPATGLVRPYPRALCLKKDPPHPLTLPSRHLRTEWTLQVPPSALGTRVARTALPLERIVFVRYSSSRQKPELRVLSRGEASLRLYQEALNQLAHPCFGLDETLSVVRRAECFELLSAAIEPTVELRRAR